MRKLLIGAGLLFLLPLGLMAQEYGPPMVELAPGFTYLRYQKANMVGWDTSVSGMLNRNLGLVVDTNGLYGTSTINSGGIQTSNNNHFYSVMAGPRVSDPRGRFVPFAEALFGYTRMDIGTNASTSAGSFLNATTDTNAFALNVGGGMDVALNHAMSVRVIDVDYMMFRANGQKTQGARISAGIVFNLGQKK